MPSISNDLAKSTQFQIHLDLHFNDINLLETALRAPGITDPDGNKGLAHVGDSSLELALRVGGFERGLSPGAVTKTINKTVGNKNLSSQCTLLGIDKFIWGNPSQGGDISKGLRADTMEAIIATYYVDQGKDFEALLRVVSVLGLGWPGNGV